MFKWILIVWSNKIWWSFICFVFPFFLKITVRFSSTASGQKLYRSITSTSVLYAGTVLRKGLIYSLAAEYAKGTHSTIMQILFCLLSYFAGNLVSMDFHPLKIKANRISWASTLFNASFLENIYNVNCLIKAKSILLTCRESTALKMLMLFAWAQTLIHTWIGGSKYFSIHGSTWDSPVAVLAIEMEGNYWLVWEFHACHKTGHFR